MDILKHLNIRYESSIIFSKYIFIGLFVLYSNLVRYKQDHGTSSLIVRIVLQSHITSVSLQWFHDKNQCEAIHAEIYTKPAIVRTKTNGRVLAMIEENKNLSPKKIKTLLKQTFEPSANYARACQIGYHLRKQRNTKKCDILSFAKSNPEKIPLIKQFTSKSILHSSEDCITVEEKDVHLVVGITNKAVMYSLIGSTCKEVPRPLQLDYTEFKEPSANVLMTGYDISWIRNSKTDQRKYVVGPCLISTHCSQSDGEVFGSHLGTQYNLEGLKTCITDQSSENCKMIENLGGHNTTHLHCWVHKRRNMERKLESLGLSSSEVIRMVEIVMGKYKEGWTPAEEHDYCQTGDYMLKGILGARHLEEFRRRLTMVQDQLHEKFVKYLISQQKILVKYFGDHVLETANLDPWEQPSTNVLEVHNKIVKDRVAEDKAQCLCELGEVLYKTQEKGLEDVLRSNYEGSEFKNFHPNAKFFFLSGDQQLRMTTNQKRQHAKDFFTFLGTGNWNVIGTKEMVCPRLTIENGYVKYKIIQMKY